MSWIKRTQEAIVHGEELSFNEVTSCIPQGSVLEPLSFVVFINDLPAYVISEVYFFVDNTKIFREIHSEGDRVQLQKDLDQLDKWSKDWLLKFHPQKFKYMKIGKDKNIFEYKLQNQRLQIVAEEKDLGVSIDDHSNFESQISAKVNKATSMFGLIQRSFQFLDRKTFISLKTY